MKILYVGENPSLSLMPIIQFAVDNNIEIVLPESMEIELHETMENKTLLFERSPVGFDDRLMDMSHISTSTAMFSPKRSKKYKGKHIK